MGFISPTDRDTIQKHFEENLTGDVEIVMFTQRASPIILPFSQQCETCSDTQHLLEEVAELSDKVSLTVHDITTAPDQADAYGIDRVPSFVVKGANRGRVRFFGIPSGYEFSAFLSDLVDASKGTTTLSQSTREFLGSLSEDLHIQVFTTPG